MTRMLRIRNWTKYQHYKDRNPPWIKLHVEILSSEDWVTLDDASKLLAMVCMVIGAKHDGCVPDNPDYIKRVAYLKKRPNLTPLIECGFLEIPQADDSESKQVQAEFRPEKETQVRKQKAETEKKVSAVADDTALAIATYNLEAAKNGWPEAQKIDAKRLRPLKTRLVECGGLDGWREAMERAGRSDFLTGRSPRSAGHENWVPDLDFFLQPSSFTKLMEGKYDNHSSAKSGGRAFDALAIALGQERSNSGGHHGGIDPPRGSLPHEPQSARASAPPLRVLPRLEGQDAGGDPLRVQALQAKS